MKILHTDLLILGLGSAGSAAVWRALQNSVSVIGVEQMPGPGGTSTFGGVNNWEPGVSFPGIHEIIAHRLIKRKEAFVGKTTKYVSADNCYAISDRSEDAYEATLKRFGVHPDAMRRLHYEPDAMGEVLQELMVEADTNHQLTLFFQSRFVSLDIQNSRICSCVLDTPDGLVTVLPKIVIDSTGDILPSRMAGCSWTVGEEAYSMYGEEAAPKNSTRFLNGITQCFRIEKTGTALPEVPIEYADVDLTSWEQYMNRMSGPVSCFNTCPRGGIDVNMLPTAEGELYLQFDIDTCKHICEARAYRYVRWLAEKGYLHGYEITHIFPLLGIRESYRLVGRYVLTIEDIYNGFAASMGKEQTIAIADHPADTHGRGSHCKDTYPGYEIPYLCIVPKEIDNLLVACRGSSFSHLAASSTRLSRTML